MKSENLMDKFYRKHEVMHRKMKGNILDWSSRKEFWKVSCSMHSNKSVNPQQMKWSLGKFQTGHKTWKHHEARCKLYTLHIARFDNLRWMNCAWMLEWSRWNSISDFESSSWMWVKYGNTYVGSGKNRDVGRGMMGKHLQWQMGGTGASIEQEAMELQITGQTFLIIQLQIQKYFINNFREMSTIKPISTYS